MSSPASGSFCFRRLLSRLQPISLAASTAGPFTNQLALERPIRLALRAVGSSSRDQAGDIVPISVRHHGDHEAAQIADGVGTDLAAISTVVGPIQSRPVEEPHGIAEIDAVLADVHLIFGFVPLDPGGKPPGGKLTFGCGAERA